MQQLGLIALILLIPAAIIIPKRWPLKKSLSLSESIARNNSSQLFFSLVFTPVTILYYGFLAWWLGPHYGVAVAYYYILLIAFVAQMVFTWVPASGKRALLTHAAASCTVVVAMQAIVGFFLFSSSLQLSPLLTLACWLFLVMGVVMAFIFFFVPRARKDYLTYELIYFLSFWIVILLLTYL